jgi:hypothetical protein
MSTSDRWLRCVGVAARAFAEAVDAALAEPAPPEAATAGGPLRPAAKPTEQVTPCHFCERPARPYTAKGKRYWRCEGGHTFDLNQPPTPAQ